MSSDLDIIERKLDMVEKLVCYFEDLFSVSHKNMNKTINAQLKAFEALVPLTEKYVKEAQEMQYGHEFLSLMCKAASDISHVSTDIVPIDGKKGNDVLTVLYITEDGVKILLNTWKQSIHNSVLEELREAYSKLEQEVM